MNNRDREPPIMQSSENRLVPKVHPATRPVEADDPYSLHATAVGGDPEVMLECLVQEYAWMGWNTEQVVGLFRNPSYPALNALLHYFGEENVRRRVEVVLKRMGVFRVSGTVHDEAEPEEEEPELIQLGISRVYAGKGDRHVQGV
jgi:hypothetical protein